MFVPTATGPEVIGMLTYLVTFDFNPLVMLTAAGAEGWKRLRNVLPDTERATRTGTLAESRTDLQERG